jgi:hypothetical protein
LAITRVKASSITQGLPKGKTALTGNSVILPGSYESIASVTVGAGGQSVVTFSSIPSTYSHLQVRVMARSAGTAQSALFISLNSTVNAIKGHYIYGNGGTVVAGANSAEQFGWGLGTSQLANSFSIAIIDILDYANTNKNKTVRSLAGNDRNGSGDIAFFSGLFDTTVAINALNINLQVGNLGQYSSIALYGIK